MDSTPSTQDRWLAPTAPIEDLLDGEPFKESAASRLVLLLLLLGLLGLALSTVVGR